MTGAKLNMLLPVIWRAFFILILPIGAWSKGHLELTMVRYVNKGSLTANKKPCDASGRCSLYFLLTLDGTAKPSDPGTSWDVIETDVYKNFNTTQRFGLWTNQRERNPIERTFEVWKGVLNLNIVVRHSTSYYPNAGDILVDNLTATIRSEADTVTREHTIYGHVHGRDSYFVIELRVACRQNYYLRNCSRHCEPHDDNYYGHYYCTQDGVKVCLANWRDLKGNCLERDYCAAQPCQNQGICTQESMWEYRCKCQAQFAGTNCEQVRPPCELHDPCRNGGTCLNAGPVTTRCACPSGWTGLYCLQDRDECLELPCRNGGHCMNLDEGRGFDCDCLGTGFKGPRCEEDENECLNDGARLCRNNGTCENKPGGFRCNCHPPFYGKDCGLCNSTHHPLGVCPKAAWVSTLSSVLVPALLLFFLLLALLVVVLLRRKRVLCARGGGEEDEDEEAEVAVKLSASRPAFQNTPGRREPNGLSTSWGRKTRR